MSSYPSRHAQHARFCPEPLAQLGAKPRGKRVKNDPMAKVIDLVTPLKLQKSRFSLLGMLDNALGYIFAMQCY